MWLFENSTESANESKGAALSVCKKTSEAGSISLTWILHHGCFNDTSVNEHRREVVIKQYVDRFRTANKDSDSGSFIKPELELDIHGAANAL